MTDKTSGTIGIIGAGPAGLTAAYILSKEGLPVDVWELDPKDVGGISRTVTYKGFRFDIGGHRFFSKSKEVEDLWSELLPHDMLVRQRLSRIYYRGRFYSYPLNVSEVIDNLGRRESLLSVASYVKAKLFANRNPANLEDWMTLKFGHRLYQMFFKTYSEKVWGRSCREISADWAAQRIKGLSLTRAGWNALLANRISTSDPVPGQDVVKTLITSFRYPRLGPGMLWESAACKVRHQGGRISMGCRAKGIRRLPEGGWQVRLEEGSTGTARETICSDLISSAPLGWLVRTLEPPLDETVREAAAGLTYRDFLTVALILKPSTDFPDNWLYIHDPDLLVGRIQNFANWSPDMVPDPSLACYGLEYFCNQTDRLWKSSDEELITLASRELEHLGLARPGSIVDGAVVRQPKAYPVYDDQYSERRSIIRKALREHCPGLHVVGRNGMHQYNNQDHSMMTAILTARNILAGQQLYDVWKVNQDAEYIEEQLGDG